MLKYEAEDLIERMEGPMEAAIGAFVNGARKNKEFDDMISLTMKLTGGSYTDFKDITVSLSEEYIEELVDEMEKETKNAASNGLSQEQIENNKKLISIYREIAKNTTERDGEIILFALSAHETAHILWSSAKDRKKIIEEIGEDLNKEGINKTVGKKFAATLDNIIEDGRIERLMGVRYPGTVRPLRFKNTLMYELDIKASEAGLVDFDDEYRSLFSILLLIAKCGLRPYAIESMTKRMQELADKIEPLIFDAILANNSKDAYKGKMNVYYAIKDLLVEILEEKSKDMDEFEELLEQLSKMLSQAPSNGEPADDSDDQSDGNGSSTITVHINLSGDGGGQGQEDEESDEEKSSGSGSGSSNGDEGDEGDDSEAGEGDSQDKDGESKDGKDDKDDKDGDKEGSKKWSQAKTNKRSNEKITKKQPSKEEVKKGLAKQKAEDKFNTEVPRERQDISGQEALKKPESKAQEAAEGIVGDFALSEYNTFTEHPRSFEVKDLPSELEGEVRRLKRIVDEFFNKPDFNLRHRDSGILDTRRLPSVKMHDYNVFKRIGQNSKIDQAIMICWDGSGSMYGKKQYESARACSIIEAAFSEYVPLKIINFSDRYGVEHFLVKDFDEKAMGRESFSYSYGQNGNFGGGNNDGMSIKVCTEELLKRPERDKILIVLSDGMPTGYSYKNPKEDVKRNVEEARAEGIEVIPIFFGDEGFRSSAEHEYKEMYKKNIINSPIEEITDNLIDLFKKLLM